MGSERLTPERLDQIEEWACNANDKEYPYPYAARGLVVVMGVWELLAEVKAVWTENARLTALLAERDAEIARLVEAGRDAIDCLERALGAQRPYSLTREREIKLALDTLRAARGGEDRDEG